MNFKTSLTFTVFLSLTFAAFTTFAQAPAQGFPQPQQNVQTDFNDKEVEKFVSVVKKVVPIEQKAQEQMIEEVQSQGLTIEKFNKIAAMQQQGQAPQGAEVSEKDLQSFSQATEQIGTIQKKAQDQIVEVVKEEDMSLQKYQQMIMAYQQDPELKEKIDQAIQKG